jgi:hypothetical protein
MNPAFLPIIVSTVSELVKAAKDYIQTAKQNRELTAEEEAMWLTKLDDAFKSEPWRVDPDPS